MSKVWRDLATQIVDELLTVRGGRDFPTTSAERGDRLAVFLDRSPGVPQSGRSLGGRRRQVAIDLVEEILVTGDGEFLPARLEELLEAESLTDELAAVEWR